jgi:hypothetical protein
MEGFEVREGAQIFNIPIKRQGSGGLVQFAFCERRKRRKEVWKRVWRHTERDEEGLGRRRLGPYVNAFIEGFLDVESGEWCSYRGRYPARGKCCGWLFNRRSPAKVISASRRFIDALF